MDDLYTKSSYRERIIEHIFLGECLRQAWIQGIRDISDLKADVDNGGYDLVLERGNITRHIQLKSSFNGSMTSNVPVNGLLGDRPSGCIIWIQFDQNTMQLGPYYFFGNPPGQPCPELIYFLKARRTTANSQGIKPERPNTFSLSKSRFKRFDDMSSLLTELFG